MADDLNLINEQYLVIREGIFDRLKAQGAGAVASVGGLGQKIAAGAKGAYAGATGNSQMARQAVKQGQSAQNLSQNAKVTSIIKSHTQKLQAAYDDFIQDLEKLQVSTPQQVQQYNQAFQVILSALTNNNPETLKGISDTSKILLNQNKPSNNGVGAYNTAPNNNDYEKL